MWRAAAWKGLHRGILFLRGENTHAGRLAVKLTKVEHLARRTLKAALFYFYVSG